jgi:hypothetical protein
MPDPVPAPPASTKSSPFAYLFPSSRNNGEGSMKMKLLTAIGAVIAAGEQAGLTPDQTLMIVQIGAIMIFLRGLEDIVKAFRKG